MYFLSLYKSVALKINENEERIFLNEFVCDCVIVKHVSTGFSTCTAFVDFNVLQQHLIIRGFLISSSLNKFSKSVYLKFISFIIKFHDKKTFFFI